MEERLKRRLIGASVLACLAAILLPMLLEERPQIDTGTAQALIPSEPEDPFASDLLDNEISAPAPLLEPTVELDADLIADPQEKADYLAQQEQASAQQVAEPAVVEAKPKGVAKARKGLSAWVVRVGSFADGSNAQRLLGRLRKKGFDSLQEAVVIRGKTWHRVYVGPVVDKAQANKLQGQIKQTLGESGKVVRYP